MNKSKSVFLIGIKGVGMTALALYLKERGAKVVGSDTEDIFVTDKLLKAADIEVFPFNSKNINKEKYDTVIVSAAYDSKHPEVKEARKKRMDVKYYSEILGEISREKKVIAVSGIHGKTTTTAMLAFILEKASLAPSYIIGSGEIPNLKANGAAGDGEYFVIEADEFRKSPEVKTPKFLDLNPQIAIITSIELDHPDMFSGIEEVFNAFYRLVCRVPRSGFIVLCLDYPKAVKLKQTIADRNFETYGFSDKAGWQIIDLNETASGSFFSLKKNNKIYGPYQIKISGKHNVLNATAAIITALKIDVPDKTLKRIMPKFQNVKRRLEKIGESKDIIILDDYAHHPTAIKATLETVRQKYPERKIYCIFQPHTYSRTEKLISEFGAAFKDADKVIITPIFSSAREQATNFTAVNLVDEIKKNRSNVKYMDQMSKIEDYLIDTLKGPSIVITIGAGDIYKLAETLTKRIEGK